MTLFLPLVYLLFGWGLGQSRLEIKTLFSSLLTKVVIPLVIIFNIAVHFQTMGWIILFSALAILLLIAIGRLWNRDPVANLCFSYLNIGWLGLPVASALFGNQAAVIIIAAYVGSSIIGNSLGASLLSGKSTNFFALLKMPPVLALFIGIFLIPFAHEVQALGQGIYQVAKFMMSFFGMAILGVWLSKVKIGVEDFKAECRPFLLRALTIAILVSLLLLLAKVTHLTLITDNPATLYLFCLLPPAANIIVLETHYLGSGRSVRPITCGTCISLVAIALYAALILGSRLL